MVDSVEWLFMVNEIDVIQEGIVDVTRPLFTWFLARLNRCQMAWSLVEIAFFLTKSLLRILSNNSLVIHGDRLSVHFFFI